MKLYASVTAIEVDQLHGATITCVITGGDPGPAMTGDLVIRTHDRQTIDLMKASVGKSLVLESPIVEAELTPAREPRHYTLDVEPLHIGVAPT